MCVNKEMLSASVLYYYLTWILASKSWCKGSGVPSVVSQLS